MTGPGMAWGNCVSYVSWQVQIWGPISRPTKWIPKGSGQLSKDFEPGLLTPCQLEASHLHLRNVSQCSQWCHLYARYAVHWAITTIIGTGCKHTCKCRTPTGYMPLLQGDWQWGWWFVRNLPPSLLANVLPLKLSKQPELNCWWLA